MKKILVGLVAMLFLFAPMAFAISYTNSGALIGVYSGNDAQSTLMSLGYSVTLLDKIDLPEDYSNTTITSGIMTLTSTDSWYSGTWETTPYLIDLYTVKAGDYFAIYSVDPLSASGTWSTEDIFVGKGNNPELSHFSSWNPTQPVPEPSTLLLFGAGIAGLAMYRRKRS